jgi:tRNA G18 (ribose-2'-O)-methylase SpoU
LSNPDSAGPSAPAAKASSGGIEGVNILCVDDVKGFIKQSQRAGWHVMAAMPPPAEEKPDTTPALAFDVSKPDSGIGKLDEEKGVLLVIGGEDAGVPEKYAEMANSFITMSRSKPDALGVDSLNVSVAAALIFSEFARTRPVGDPSTENLLF